MSRDEGPVLVGHPFAFCQLNSMMMMSEFSSLRNNARHLFPFPVDTIEIHKVPTDASQNISEE